MEQLIRDTVLNHDEKTIFRNENGKPYGEFVKNYSPGMGLICCGEFDDDVDFRPEYIFPYFKGSSVSMKQEVEFEKHAREESYAGACEDPRIGATLIFYLNNMGQYRKSLEERHNAYEERTIKLSALAKEGTVLLPSYRMGVDCGKIEHNREAHYRLISEARGGDEAAIEALTEQDMADYSVVSKRVLKEDVLSIVDTSFLPYGVECDQYSILGNIITCEKVKNQHTNEFVYQMQVEVCDVYMDVCINESRIEGIPSPGFRFRGLIWLQGFVSFDL